MENSNEFRFSFFFAPLMVKRQKPILDYICQGHVIIELDKRQQPSKGKRLYVISGKICGGFLRECNR